MIDTKTKKLTSRPPIVVVLGHVDHGKTTLLDTIRKTNVTAREAGGITQHIGAYQINITNKEILRQAQDDRAQNCTITFIDTPGHETFAKMRSRGVEIADIAVLVVAANDGVMPQTIESIKHIQQAQIPMIVAMNKIDLPDIDPQKIKQQLAQNQILVEGFGGEVVLMPISAKTNKGISDLLEMILLMAQMKGLTADPEALAEGVVIEAKLDKKRGALATVIVKNGTLKIGQTCYADDVKCKIKAMISDKGDMVQTAPPAYPVVVMGWEKLPAVGSVVSTVSRKTEEAVTKFPPKAFSLPPVETVKKLKMILRADVAGTLEAILENLGEKVEIISAATGSISDSDVLLAKSTEAIIIGFHTSVSPTALKLATLEKVKIKTYNIIYELLDEIHEVVEILNMPAAQEEVLGEANVIAEFAFDDARVAGCKVTKGRIARGDLVKIISHDTEIGRTKIKSLRHGKENIPKAESGTECGAVLDKKLDFKIGDSIISYKMHDLLV